MQLFFRLSFEIFIIYRKTVSVYRQTKFQKFFHQSLSSVDDYEKLSIIHIPLRPLSSLKNFPSIFRRHHNQSQGKESVTDEREVRNIDLLMPSCVHFYHASLVRYCVHFSLASTIPGDDFNIIFPSVQLHVWRKIDHFQDWNFHDITKLLNLFSSVEQETPPQYDNNACENRMFYKVGVMPENGFLKFSSRFGARRLNDGSRKVLRVLTHQTEFLHVFTVLNQWKYRKKWWTKYSIFLAADLIRSPGSHLFVTTLLIYCSTCFRPQ